MWSHGFIEGSEYWVKHYDEGSVFGIDGGRISKLTVKRGGKEIVSYERGWDVEPSLREQRRLDGRLLRR